MLFPTLEKELGQFSKTGKSVQETPEQPYIVTAFLNKLSEQRGKMKNERKSNSLLVDCRRSRDYNRYVYACSIHGDAERLQAVERKMTMYGTCASKVGGMATAFSTVVVMCFVARA